MSFLKSLFGGGSAKVNIRTRFEMLRDAAISGTMSSFHMARDRKTGDVVGLKILDVKKTKQLEDRFIGLSKPREGEIALTLSHPNIVKSYECGLTTNGEQYLVMEFLDGPGLNSLIVARNEKLAGKRLTLIRQMAEAIGAVHRAGYIHRDICPRNFVVAKDCSSLKLIDFGLTVPATGPFMQPGNRTGTANYMAPEVVRRRPTSQRLDVFSFGVTAFELCTWELPWPKGTGKEAMVHGVEEPFDIFELAPWLNRRLAAAIMACLAPKPEDRPESMERFLAMIRGVERETEK